LIVLFEWLPGDSGRISVHRAAERAIGGATTPNNLGSIGPRSYAEVVQAFSASTHPFWAKLDGTGTLAGVLLRVMSPAQATTWTNYTTKDPNFPVDHF